MINKLKSLIIEGKQKIEYKKLEKILGDEKGKFWKRNPTDKQVRAYYDKINQFYKNSITNLTQKLEEFKQNPSKKTALSFERRYDHGRLYEVELLERIRPSFDRKSNYVSRGLIGLTEIAEDLNEINRKQAKKLAGRVYNWGLYWFHPNRGVEESLKYWYCDENGFGLALPHVNNGSYPIELLYSIVKSSKLIGKTDELKYALSRVPAIKKFLETNKGEKLKNY